MADTLMELVISLTMTFMLFVLSIVFFIVKNHLFYVYMKTKYEKQGRSINEELFWNHTSFFQFKMMEFWALSWFPILEKPVDKELNRQRKNINMMHLAMWICFLLFVLGIYIVNKIV